MNLLEWARQAVAILPSDSSAVTISRADLKALVDGTGEARSPAPPARDLSVEEVAEEVGRAPSTVRGWLIAGELRGYKLNRRDWRVPRADLQAYLEGQGAPGKDGAWDDDALEDVDIREWRRFREP